MQYIVNFLLFKCFKLSGQMICGTKHILQSYSLQPPNFLVTSSSAGRRSLNPVLDNRTVLSWPHRKSTSSINNSYNSRNSVKTWLVIEPKDKILSSWCFQKPNKLVLIPAKCIKQTHFTKMIFIIYRRYGSFKILQPSIHEDLATRIVQKTCRYR